MNNGTHTLWIKSSKVETSQSGQFVTGLAAIKFYGNKAATTTDIHFVSYRKAAKELLKQGNIAIGIGELATREAQGSKDPDYVFEISQIFVTGHKPVGQPVAAAQPVAPAIPGDDIDF